MRTLKITQSTSGIGKVGARFLYKLDGVAIGVTKKNGESISRPIDDRAYSLEAVQVSLLGTPAIGSSPATLMIVSGGMDCVATASLRLGLVKTTVHLEASYDLPPVSEDAFVNAVTALMVTIFSGDAILERLNDPNNRRNDLEVFCAENGVHILWQENQPSEWSKGYGEEIIPYAASHTDFPKERLTPDVLDRLNRAARSGILSRTRFVQNQYGCFMLGTKKPNLY